VSAGTPRFAPEFGIAVNDNPVPAALRASISGVSFQTALEGSDRVELTVINENLRWLDDPALRLDNKLALSIGYAPDPLKQVFVGDIVGHTAAFPSGGFPTLTVAAQDRREHLQQGAKARWFGISIPKVGNYPLPDQAAVGLVAVESGLIPIFDPVGAAIAVILGGVELIAAADNPNDRQKLIRKQERESDGAFLSRIAKENAWEMLIDHSEPQGGHKLRFMSPLDHVMPDVTLRYGHSLIEFTPRVSTVGQIVSVTALVWIAKIKTQFAITVGWDWDRMALTLDISAGSMPSRKGPSDVLIAQPVTLASAARTIVGELIPKLNKRLTGSGSTVGDPRIRAGSVLQLEGLGAEFGGLYRVTSATHSIDGGGYRTSFDVRKEIWFGSIPLPQQGAALIRLRAPFVA
jgi:hypothetical protein